MGKAKEYLLILLDRFSKDNRKINSTRSEWNSKLSN